MKLSVAARRSTSTQKAQQAEMKNPDTPLSIFDAKKHPQATKTVTSYLPEGVLIQKNYFFLVFAARSAASAASIFAVVEMPHFFI